jgi:hypothetical protein
MATQTQSRRVGVKRQLFAMFKAGKSGTIAQLMRATKGSEVSVRTALYDLRSDKYGVGGRALPLQYDERGVWALPRRSVRVVN